MSRFYHRTCIHAAERIEASGTLTPHPQPMLSDMPLIWLSPWLSGSAAALGLGGQRLVSCDRMECLFIVVPEDEGKVMPWTRFKQTPELEPLLPFARLLEAAHGAKPDGWAVAGEPLRVLRLA